MAALPQYAPQTISANGRYLIGTFGNVDIGVNVSGGNGLGGGALSIQASYEGTPVLATDAHWLTLAGAENIEGGYIHPVRMNSVVRLAVLLTGATSPTVVITRS